MLQLFGKEISCLGVFYPDWSTIPCLINILCILIQEETFGLSILFTVQISLLETMNIGTKKMILSRFEWDIVTHSHVVTPDQVITTNHFGAAGTDSNKVLHCIMSCVIKCLTESQNADQAPISTITCCIRHWSVEMLLHLMSLGCVQMLCNVATQQELGSAMVCLPYQLLLECACKGKSV